MRGTVWLLLPLLIAPAAGAATFRVPSEYPTIQGGLDVAAPGDTVELACGTYFEHDIVMTSGTTLRSEAGESACVSIDAQQLGRVLLGVDLADSTLIEGRARRLGRVWM